MGYAYDTAANIVNQASVELGLSPSADVYGATDANMVQLRYLLNTAGRTLVKLRPWTHLQREYTFTTSATGAESGPNGYSLPADFRAPLPATTWDRSTRFPVGNSLTPQEWQALKGQAAVSLTNVLVRVQRGRLFVYPPEDTGSLVAYEYLTSYWVQPVGQTAPTADAPTANLDVICFDALLAMQALKVAWLEAKGFDATAAQNALNGTYELVAGEDAPAATLTLGGGGDGIPLLGFDNLPTSGYGD